MDWFGVSPCVLITTKKDSKKHSLNNVNTYFLDTSSGNCFLSQDILAQ